MDEQTQIIRQQLALHISRCIHDFQRNLLLNRKRTQQRVIRRQKEIKNFIIHQMLKAEMELFQTFPIIHGLHFNIDCTKSIPRNSRLINFDLCQLTPEDWLHKFHMQKKTFMWLHSKLSKSVIIDNDSGPSSLEQFAMIIFILTQGIGCQTASGLFKVDKNCVSALLLRFANVLINELPLIRMPNTEEEYNEIRENLSHMSKVFPTCVGILGVREIFVTDDPSIENKQYMNDSGNRAIILQALVDDKMLFRKVEIDLKRPKMLLDSPNIITRLGMRLIKDDYIPCFIITPANDYYPLSEWLMQRYRNPQSAAECRFNASVDRLDNIKMEAFRRLFSRFRILQNACIDLEPHITERLAIACCALHNLLEENDMFCKRWAVKNSKLNCIFEKTQNYTEVQSNQSALRIRDILAEANNT